MNISWKLSKKSKSCIVKDYKNNMSMKKICKKYKVCRASIYRILRNRDVSLRKKYAKIERIYKLNERVFSKINEHSAYWAGFLLADGNIFCAPRTKPRITLELSIKDKYHIKKFKKFCQAGHPMRLGHKNKSIAIAFCSKLMAQDLKKLGITPQKITRVHIKLLQNNRHFWRGVIDGDGSVCICNLFDRKRPALKLVGSKLIVNSFFNFIHSKNIKTNARTRRLKDKKNLYSLNIGEGVAYQVIKLLYKNSNIFLTRKFLKAKLIMHKFSQRYFDD